MFLYRRLLNTQHFYCHLFEFFQILHQQSPANLLWPRTCCFYRCCCSLSSANHKQYFSTVGISHDLHSYAALGDSESCWLFEAILGHSGPFYILLSSLPGRLCWMLPHSLLEAHVCQALDVDVDGLLMPSHAENMTSHAGPSSPHIFRRSFMDKSLEEMQWLEITGARDRGRKVSQVYSQYEPIKII